MTRYTFFLVIFPIMLLSNCSQSELKNQSSATLSEDTAIMVNAFSKEHIYFAKENKRSIINEVDFPSFDQKFKQITMKIGLDCPNNRCDHWDRKGSINVLTEEQGKIEILRFATPYGIGGQWKLDVTDLRPLLQGLVSLEAFIDTWVGPGHAQGDGWLINVTFEFISGQPEREVVAVIPILESQSIIYGDPEQETSRNRSVAIPKEYKQGLLWVQITGHGQANTENCAEFCPKKHSVDLAGAQYSRIIWRDDCHQNPIRSFGTWTFPRAGWCPGDIVRPWQIPVNLDLSASAEFIYDVEPYENHRREGYNGGSHTEPFYQVSTMLILYDPIP